VRSCGATGQGGPGPWARILGQAPLLG
jgi:hypothetical protein